MKTRTDSLGPRLISKLERGGIIGYLQLDPESAPMKIGAVDSPEFKLVESLFDPSWSQTSYHTAKRDSERVYAKTTGVSRKFHKTSRIYDRIRAVLNEIILDLRETEAGKYLSFTQGPTHMAMNIHSRRRFA